MRMPVQDSVWHLLWSWLRFCTQELRSMTLMRNNCTCKCSGNCKMSVQFTLPCSVWKLDSPITANEQQWVHLWEWMPGSERNLYQPASNIIQMPRWGCWASCAVNGWIFIPNWYLKDATAFWDGWHGRIWSLESQLCRAGIQLPCVHGGPYKVKYLGSFLQEGWMCWGKREVKCSWVLLQIEFRSTRDAQKDFRLGKCFLIPMDEMHFQL